VGVGEAALGPFFGGLWQIARSGISKHFAGFPQMNRSPAEGYPVQTRTGGLQRKFSGFRKATEHQNAMHQTAHCQEVHA